MTTTITTIELSDDAREALAQAIRYEDESVAEAFTQAMNAEAIQAAIELGQTYLRLFVAANAGDLARDDLPAAVAIVKRELARELEAIEYERHLGGDFDDRARLANRCRAFLVEVAG
jgi:hypothetical protein